MLAALILSLQTVPTLLVSRLEGATVQLVAVTLPGGTEKVIHTHPLSFTEGREVVDEGRIFHEDTVDEEFHNESLVRSLAFALDRNRRCIACLNVVRTHVEHQKGGNTASWRGWSLDADLMTLDYSGKTVARERISFPGNATTFLGVGDDGRAALIVRPDERPSEYGGVKPLPESFRRLLGRGEARLESRAAQSLGKVPPIDDLAGSPAWTDVALPRFSRLSGDARLCVDLGRNAAVLYGDDMLTPNRWLHARWGDRLASWDLGERDPVPMHLYPLDYPDLVGRDLKRGRMPARFQNRPLGEIDPYLEAEIVIYDLATKKARPVCRGVLAMPM